ncbi:NAD(P)H-dependent oxidoreductase [Allobacillus sp. SKP2-8]|uniref:NADPH-dependent FMN reductase n=1 Tax=unclassified Allobacillus TaxID=2628859 RepID=UPI001183A916|nr:NADPH-dependent FMN reductase [Allobacillus sp. SKP2-8]TSJ65784.1 NAD(P)H-dependent oxidoreductase [Allobacillus sp. SKP2-8]
MKIVTLSGSIVGSKTRTAIDYTVQSVKEKCPEHAVTLIDLADYDIQFSDGRNYLDYDGDTKYVTQTIMDADAIILGTPIFQASIPATLKNIFDLLPVDALRDKVVSMLATAGTSKHFLIPEHHLKPILGYMKAQVVQSYVFIQEKDFDQKKIINDDVFFRIDRLVEDTVILADTYQKIKEEDDKKYDF